ncbi:MAG: hypothetical protein V1825_04045 [Candidatus Falkowbacteria bacterium]|nr:hypothetical protein [Candidatus Parcubacteria bacterium]
MPKAESQLLSVEEAKQLLEFFEKNEHLIINRTPNQALLKIIFKIHLKSNIVNVGLPKGANIKKDGLHISLTEDGKKQLELFL